MVYKELTLKEARRVMDAFYAHHAYLNEEYKKFSNPDDEDYSITDRERFVNRLFGKYVGKYFALIDKVYWGRTTTNHVFVAEEQSIYDAKFKEHYAMADFKDIIIPRKTYLFVSSISAVNQYEGPGYICVYAMDEHGTNRRIKLDLHHMQWVEISKDEYEQLARLFADDRSEVGYACKRWLSPQELKDKGLYSNKKSASLPTVDVDVCMAAKDRDEAIDKVWKKYGNNTFLSSDMERMD